MTDLFRMAENPLALRLGHVLVHFVWQGAAIGALASWLLVMLRRASPQARYAALLAALGLAVLSPVATFALLRAEPGAAAAMIIARPDSLVVPSPGASRPLRFEPDSPTAALAVAAPAALSAQPPFGSPLQPFTAWLARVRSWPAWLDARLSWVVLGWLCGVCVLCLRLLIGLAGAERLRRTGVRRAGDGCDNLLASLRARLRMHRSVQVLESLRTGVPSVIGWLRPVILLPASALTGLTPPQLEAILAHELAHIRRHDYLVNMFQNVIETLLFYHPVVWWLSHRIRQEREQCCDDVAAQVCGDRVVVARALATLEGLRVPRSQLALAARGGNLLRRVRRLLAPSDSHVNHAPWWPAGTIAVAVLAALMVGARMSASASIADDRAEAVQPASPDQPGHQADTAATSLSPAPGSEPPEPTKRTADAAAEPQESNFAVRVFRLKYARARDAQATLEQVLGPDRDTRDILAADERTNAIIIRSMPDRLALIEAIISKLDSPSENDSRAPSSAATNQNRANRVAGALRSGSNTAAAGTHLDLVSLATTYIEAVEKLELARLRFNILDRHEAKVVSQEELETAQINMQAAERKVKVLRQIARVAYDAAAAEAQTARAAYEAGHATQGQVVEADARLKILEVILESMH